MHKAHWVLTIQNRSKHKISYTHQICSWAWQSTQSPEGSWLHVCSWRWHGNSSWWSHSGQWPHRSAHLVERSPLWSRWCEWTHGVQTRTQWVEIHHHLWVVSMTAWQMSSQHQQSSAGQWVGRVDLNIRTNQLVISEVKIQLFKWGKKDNDSTRLNGLVLLFLLFF